MDRETALNRAIRHAEKADDYAEIATAPDVKPVTRYGASGRLVHHTNLSLAWSSIAALYPVVQSGSGEARTPTGG